MTVAELPAFFASRPAAVAGIVLANLVPVFGVLFLGWDAGQILLLYWAENVILGVLTLPRLIASAKGRFEGWFLAAFFCVHYGLFCAGHLVFAMLMISDFDRLGEQGYSAFLTIVETPGFLWGVAAVAAISVFTQIRDFWLPGLWRTADPKKEMAKPYGRIFVLHLTVLIGAGVVLSFNGPTFAILVLCLLKAALELGLLAFAATGKAEDEAPA